MRLQAPPNTTGDLHCHGRSFPIAADGTVEIPDDLVGSTIWQMGYTVAVGKKTPAMAEPVAPINKDKGKDNV